MYTTIFKEVLEFYGSLDFFDMHVLGGLGSFVTAYGLLLIPLHELVFSEHQLTRY